LFLSRLVGKRQCPELARSGGSQLNSPRSIAMTRGTAYEGTVEGGPLTQRITQCRAYYRPPAFADLSRSGAEPSRSRLGNRRRCAAAPVTGSPSAATGGRRPQIVRRVRPREG